MVLVFIYDKHVSVKKQYSTATAISCLPTPSIYKKPFLPPFIPKLSNIAKIIKKKDGIFKLIFCFVNKFSEIKRKKKCIKIRFKKWRNINDPSVQNNAEIYS